MCPEAKGDDTSFVSLVNASELLRELALGDIRSVGVEDVNDELASGQESVCDKFSRADGYWGVGLTGESWSVCDDPSVRRVCHPSLSSSLSIVPFSWMAVLRFADAALTIL